MLNESIIKKNQIKDAMLKQYGGINGDYNKWLLVWDLLNGSFYEIKNSINKRKISISDLKEVVANCNSVHKIFDIDLICENIQISRQLSDEVTFSSLVYEDTFIKEKAIYN